MLAPYLPPPSLQQYNNVNIKQDTNLETQLILEFSLLKFNLLNFKFQNQTQKIPVVQLSSNFKIWGQLIQGFMSYDRTSKYENLIAYLNP